MRRSAAAGALAAGLALGPAAGARAPAATPAVAGGPAVAGARRAAAARVGSGPARLLVTATEFRLSLSRPVLQRGRAIVELANRGQDGHDLVVRRLSPSGHETGVVRRLAEVRAGGLGTLRTRLPAGRYVLFCSLPGHRAAGMHARLRVR